MTTLLDLSTAQRHGSDLEVQDALWFGSIVEAMSWVDQQPSGRYAVLVEQD